jgi:hypothetical protein
MKIKIITSILPQCSVSSAAGLTSVILVGYLSLFEGATLEHLYEIIKKLAI